MQIYSIVHTKDNLQRTVDLIPGASYEFCIQIRGFISKYMSLQICISCSYFAAFSIIVIMKCMVYITQYSSLCLGAISLRFNSSFFSTKYTRLPIYLLKAIVKLHVGLFWICHTSSMLRYHGLIFIIVVYKPNSDLVFIALIYSLYHICIRRV